MIWIPALVTALGGTITRLALARKLLGNSGDQAEENSEKLQKFAEAGEKALEGMSTEVSIPKSKLADIDLEFIKGIAPDLRPVKIEEKPSDIENIEPPEDENRTLFDWVRDLFAKIDQKLNRNTEQMEEMEDRYDSLGNKVDKYQLDRERARKEEERERPNPVGDSLENLKSSLQSAFSLLGARVGMAIAPFIGALGFLAAGALLGPITDLLEKVRGIVQGWGYEGITDFVTEKYEDYVGIAAGMMGASTTAFTKKTTANVSQRVYDKRLNKRLTNKKLTPKESQYLKSRGFKLDEVSNKWKYAEAGKGQALTIDDVLKEGKKVNFKVKAPAPAGKMSQVGTQFKNSIQTVKSSLSPFRIRAQSGLRAIGNGINRFVKFFKPLIERVANLPLIRSLVGSTSWFGRTLRYAFQKPIRFIAVFEALKVAYNIAVDPQKDDETLHRAIKKSINEFIRVAGLPFVLGLMIAAIPVPPFSWMGAILIGVLGWAASEQLYKYIPIEDIIDAIYDYFILDRTDGFKDLMRRLGEWFDEFSMEKLKEAGADALKSALDFISGTDVIAEEEDVKEKYGEDATDEEILKGATDRLNTDENSILYVFKDKTQEDYDKISEIYREKYKKSLEAVLQKNLGGPNGEEYLRLKQMIAMNTEKAKLEAVENLSEVEKEIIEEEFKTKEAVFLSEGKDQQAIMDILKEKTVKEYLDLEKFYQKKYDDNLSQVLGKKLSDDNFDKLFNTETGYFITNSQKQRTVSPQQLQTDEIRPAWMDARFEDPDTGEIRPFKDEQEARKYGYGAGSLENLYSGKYNLHKGIENPVKSEPAIPEVETSSFTESVSFTFSERDFMERDPENYKLYSEFKQKRIQELIDEAKEDGTYSLGDESIFEVEAKADAVLEFKDIIEVTKLQPKETDQIPASSILPKDDGSTNVIVMENKKESSGPPIIFSPIITPPPAPDLPPPSQAGGGIPAPLGSNDPPLRTFDSVLMP